MAKSPEEIAAIAEALGGKKAKRKKVSSGPEGTKEKKLPKEVRAGLEQHFGAKLSKVRIHSGGNIKDVCKEVKARAFTIGNDVYFMRPGDAKNSELLAHELTHVLQQGHGRMPKPKDGLAWTSK